MFYGFIEGNYKLVSRYTISRFILVNDVGITQFYDSRISMEETEEIQLLQTRNNQLETFHPAGFIESYCKSLTREDSSWMGVTDL